MAVIRFNPTWIATISYDLVTGEESYSYDYPIKSDSAYRGDDGLVAFDMFAIRDLINLLIVTEKYLVMKIAIEGLYGLPLHDSTEPPSENHYVFPEPTAGLIRSKEEGDYYKVYLDDSLARPGPSSPIAVDFIEAIALGYKGFGFAGDVSIDEVFIELEGSFDNPRPTPARPIGGEVQNLQETIRFSWNHNSPLEQESFEVRYRVKGASNWTTTQENTNNRYYDLAPNTLETNEYEWQVRTTSEYGFVSPWSLTQVFNAADVTPSPIFTKPIQNEVIEVSDLHVEWDSIEQNRYEFELRDSGNNVIWSDARLSTNQEITIEDILENNQSYRLRLRVNQEGNLFSSWAEIDISVDYTEPALPVLTLTPDKETGSIEVDIHNPPPTGTEPAPTHQELFRRKVGGQWVKLANLVPNSTYIDHTPASGKIYEYRAIVQADNDTSSTSDIFSGSVKVRYSQLNLTSNKAEMVRLIFNPGISFSKNYTVTTKSFAGRKKPVAEFGELISQSGAMDFVVDDDTLNRLYEFLERQETLLFRDSRGKKIFAVISDINVNYHSARMHGSYLYEISLSLTEVYYDEGVD